MFARSVPADGRNSGGSGIGSAPAGRAVHRAAAEFDVFVADAAAKPCREERLVHQRARRQWIKFGREKHRVVSRHAKDQESAGVAKYGGADRGIELVDVLVRQTEVRRKFARFGEQRRERVGAERLELVDVGEERHPVLGCLGAAPHRRELQVRDQKRAEQIRRLLPYPAFRQIGDENAAVLHRIAEVELGRVLAEHGAQRRRSGKSRQGIPVRST